ncbi:MAG: alpha-glucoside ABC transporter permease, partial [Pseudomonadota bacterium]|nr:alpha-glucoside ABC transporter permease [Pseudomonadota bacterium]
MSVFQVFTYVFFGVSACVAYFVVANWVYDFVGMHFKKRSAINSKIRPWIFLAPAICIIVIFLIYPVLQTLKLSFYDSFGREFVGLSNYTWAINDQDFRQSI